MARRVWTIHRDGSVSHRGEVVGRVRKVSVRGKRGATVEAWQGFIGNKAVGRPVEKQSSAARNLIRLARPAGAKKPRVSRSEPGQYLLPFGRRGRRSDRRYTFEDYQKELEVEEKIRQRLRERGLGHLIPPDPPRRRKTPPKKKGQKNWRAFMQPDADTYVVFLEETLIPDMRESGTHYTADDLQKVADHIKRKTRDGAFEDFLKKTLIPDLQESGTTATADTFLEGLYWMAEEAGDDASLAALGLANRRPSFWQRLFGRRATVPTLRGTMLTKWADVQEHFGEYDIDQGAEWDTIHYDAGLWLDYRHDRQRRPVVAVNSSSYDECGEAFHLPVSKEVLEAALKRVDQCNLSMGLEEERSREGQASRKSLPPLRDWARKSRGAGETREIVYRTSFGGVDLRILTFPGQRHNVLQYRPAGKRLFADARVKSFDSPEDARAFAKKHLRTWSK